MRQLILQAHLDIAGLGLHTAYGVLENCQPTFSDPGARCNTSTTPGKKYGQRAEYLRDEACNLSRKLGHHSFVVS